MVEKGGMAEDGVRYQVMLDGGVWCSFRRTDGLWRGMVEILTSSVWMEQV